VTAKKKGGLRRKGNIEDPTHRQGMCALMQDLKAKVTYPFGVKERGKKKRRKNRCPMRKEKMAISSERLGKEGKGGAALKGKKKSEYEGGGRSPSRSNKTPISNGSSGQGTGKKPASTPRGGLPGGGRGRRENFLQGKVFSLQNCCGKGKKNNGGGNLSTAGTPR